MVDSAVYAAANSPTAAPSSTPKVVSAMQSIIPGWDLNEAESYTVLVVFFLVALALLGVVLYYFCFAGRSSGGKASSADTDEPEPGETSTTSSNNEERPLLSPSKTASNVPALRLLLAPPGMTVLMYSSKGPKTVKLSLQGDSVVWEAATSIFSLPLSSAQRRYSVPLSSVLFVTPNKRSKNLRAKAVVPDELCLSLVTHDASLDLSVDRRAERDVLVLGFGELVELVKQRPQAAQSL